MRSQKCQSCGKIEKKRVAIDAHKCVTLFDIVVFVEESIYETNDHYFQMEIELLLVFI